MNSFEKFRALPKGAMIVLVIMSGAFLVGASLVYIGLIVPGDGTVIDTPVEVTYFSSSVSSFHFGSVGLNNSSAVVPFTVTNTSPTTRTLHVYASEISNNKVYLVVTLTNGTPYTPTSLAPGASLNLEAHLEADADAPLGPLSLSISMD